MSTTTATRSRTRSETTARTQDLLAGAEAAQLGRLFKLLSGAGRLRLLHALDRHGPFTVCDLAEVVEMSTQAASNQLQRLADRGMVIAQRTGKHVRYRLVEAGFTTMLTHARNVIDRNSAAAKGRA